MLILRVIRSSWKSSLYPERLLGVGTRAENWLRNQPRPATLKIGAIIPQVPSLFHGWINAPEFRNRWRLAVCPRELIELLRDVGAFLEARMNTRPILTYFCRHLWFVLLTDPGPEPFSGCLTLWCCYEIFLGSVKVRRWFVRVSGLKVRVKGDCWQAELGAWWRRNLAQTLCCHQKYRLYIIAKIFICIVPAGTSKDSMSFGFLHITALALAFAWALALV